MCLLNTLDVHATKKQYQSQLEFSFTLLCASGIALQVHPLQQQFRFTGRCRLSQKALFFSSDAESAAPPVVKRAVHCLGIWISKQPNLCHCLPWSAPQVLHPSKTGCPWLITTLRNLQHSVKTRPHSAAVSMMLSTTATAIPNLLPHSRSFTMGASIFTSRTRAPEPEPLGFVNTRLYKGCFRDFFVSYTETELVWARLMDYVLL
jgi:hypothetical protein